MAQAGADAVMVITPYCFKNTMNNNFIYLFLFIYLATQHTIQMSQRMSEAGADAVMVITPYYFKNAMNNNYFYLIIYYLFILFIYDSYPVHDKDVMTYGRSRSWRGDGDYPLLLQKYHE